MVKVNYNKMLMEAAEKGDLPKVKEALENFADLHVEDNFALRVSIINNHLEVVKYLIESRANIFSIYYTPLYLDYMNERIGILEYKTEIEAKKYLVKEAPFNIACKNGYLEIVEYLVENGADVHYDDDSPMYESCRFNHLNLVKYLYYKDVRIYGDDLSFIRIASLKGHIEIVKYLVEHGACICTEEDGFDYDIREDTPLCNACSEGHMEIVKYLIDEGADVHLSDESPMRVACEKNQLDIVKYLLKVGARFPEDILYFVSNLFEYKSYEVINYFAEKYVDFTEHIISKCLTNEYFYSGIYEEPIEVFIALSKLRKKNPHDDYRNYCEKFNIEYIHFPKLIRAGRALKFKKNAKNSIGSSIITLNNTHNLSRL